MTFCFDIRQTPALSDVIDWKQSFFLNLISQLPCTLTISICRKDDVKNNRSSEDLNQRPSEEKKSMVANRRITKKVYASPYKSRMDKKEASMNECSYPLIFYSVNDFTENSLHLSISASEYLCAELSLTIPKVHSTAGYVDASQNVADITVEDDSSAFPLPDSHTKVIFFQGAVSFKALSDVYQQKGISALNQMKSGWGKKDAAPDLPRTEFILMRGPHGKDQCQGIVIF